MKIDHHICPCMLAISKTAVKNFVTETGIVHKHKLELATDYACNIIGIAIVV